MGQTVKSDADSSPTDMPNPGALTDRINEFEIEKIMAAASKDPNHPINDEGDLPPYDFSFVDAADESDHSFTSRDNTKKGHHPQVKDDQMSSLIESRSSSQRQPANITPDRSIEEKSLFNPQSKALRKQRTVQENKKDPSTSADTMIRSSTKAY